MKKLILFASALCMSVCAMAQSEFYVYKKDGSSVQFTIADVDSISFTAPATGTGTANGHEWVDLGLPSGTKWATCNVGATKPEEYGNYYAWGETTTKATYSWNTYTLTTDGGSTFTKYNTTDGKTVLELADDAARANWGGAWRMPTDAEWTELRENCTWTWTTKNGVNGYEVKSKTNGNSIFLPAAGYRNGDVLSNAGNYGDYWSGSLGTGYPDYAWSVYFYSDYVYRYDNDRFCGLSVRAVFK